MSLKWEILINFTLYLQRVCCSQCSDNWLPGCWYQMAVSGSSDNKGAMVATDPIFLPRPPHRISCRQLQTLELSPTLRNTTWCVASFEYFEHYSRVLCKIVIIFTTLEWYNMANNLYFASKCFILSIFTLA